MTQTPVAISKEQLMALTSVLVSRSGMAAMLGQQFGGDRDMYQALGYVLMPLFEDYHGRYRRQDIAGRVVDLPAQDHWRIPPVVQDTARRNSKRKTPFVEAWEALVKKRQVYHYLERIDRLAGVGRFGLLLIGVRDGKPLSAPLEKGSLTALGPEGVLFLSPFSEGSITVPSTAWITDTQNERYGLPETYTLQMGSEGAPTKTEVVHWSRVVHVADDLLEDDVYGRPRLERVLNRLYDLEKIVGGGAEATWKVMDRGIHADVRDGHEMEDDEAEATSDEIEEYTHGLRRFIRTRGMDINSLGSDEVDPSGLFEMITSLIAAASEIPKRILLGSERGELASSQDEANWARSIASRQTSFGEPMILRPFIDRLIYAGALPAPRNNEYTVTWSPLFELNPMEKATTTETLTKAGANLEAAAKTAGYTEEQAKELATPARVQPLTEPPTKPKPAARDEDSDERDEEEESSEAEV